MTPACAAAPDAPNAPPGRAEPGRLLDLVRRRTGLDTAQPSFLRRLAAAGALPDAAALEAEADDAPAWQALLDRVLIPESYLFRDPAQCDLLRRSLRVQDRPPGSTLALWSAGCCAGEEAYTLAVLAVQALCAAGFGTDADTWFALAGGWQVQVLGTEIAEAALVRAAAARYPTGALSAFRATPPDALRYFPALSPTCRAVRPDVRRLVRFRRESLLQARPEPASFDAVVCRNVLVYFTAEARARVLATLSFALRPGGLLALGPADPAPDPACFRAIWGTDSVVYRRTGRPA